MPLVSPDEASKVVAILLQADSGCPSCAGDLVLLFAGSFPEHTALAFSMYRLRHGYNPQ